jgi:hypothetical protein
MDYSASEVFADIRGRLITINKFIEPDTLSINYNDGFDVSKAINQHGLLHEKKALEEILKAHNQEIPQ